MFTTQAQKDINMIVLSTGNKFVHVKIYNCGER